MYRNFVSKNSIDDEKKARKDFFQQKLKKAQSEYEAVKKKQRLEEERGDTTWMLPTLEKRIADEEDEIKSKKKKKKKEKHKKSKKHKKHKSKQKGTGGSSSEEESDEWEEAGDKVVQSHKTIVNVQSPDTLHEQREVNHAGSVQNMRDDGSTSTQKIQREEWMQSTSLLDLASTMTSSRVNKTKQRKEEQRLKEEKERESVHRARELNPYLKDGGSGMPETSSVQTHSESTRNINIGDGGRSWIEKAYQRAIQQSQDEGIPLEEIVNKRWGSMAKLNALLKSANRSQKSTTEKASSGWRKGDSKYHQSSRDDRSNRNSSRRNADHLEPETVEKSENRSLPKRTESSGTSSESDEEEISIDHVDKRSPIAVEESANQRTTLEKERKSTRPLTEKEKNELGAKILRAELMGDEELAAEYRSQLESGVLHTVAPKNEREQKQDINEKDSGDEGVEILTRQDKHGNLYPVKLKSDVEDLNAKRKIKKKIMTTHDKDGQRVRYFEDDDNVNLKTMVEQERLTSASDHLAMTSRLAAKHLGKTQGDDYTVDDMFVSASATKGATRNEEKRIKEQAVIEHKQREKQLAACRFCFENPRIAKHLIISIGKKSYLALPINASLTSGHCLIIPMNHVIGQTFLDEDVMAEVKLFKKHLVRMFADQEEDVIFMETCKNLKYQNHCLIECVPVDREIGDMAPIYFKKALLECESEWSQNKKVVDISAKLGLSSAVPKGLPYFAVEFGGDGGFAHVIEEEESFAHYFGKEIIGGMLDLEPRMWRKPPKESFEQHKKKVIQFAEQWKPYDWTQKQ